MNDDYDDITANYHGGNERSIEANDSLVPHKQIMRTRLLALIDERGESGITCDEAEIITGWRHQSVSARFSEMKCDEIITARGTRVTRSGRNADVYRLVTGEEGE